MKILAFTFSSDFRGGANRSFLMVLTYLRDVYGHTIHVIEPEKGAFTEKLEAAGFSHEVIPLPNKLVGLNYDVKDVVRKLKANLNARRIRRAARREAKRFTKEGYDLVYVNVEEHPFGGYLAEELGLPCVWHFRGRFTKKNYYMHRQERFFGGERSHVIVISNQMKQDLPHISHIPDERIYMVHNGLEWEEHAPSAQDRSRGIHAVLCGRINAAKGHKDAIAATALLHEEGYDLHLHIVGDTSIASDAYLEELRAAIASHKLEAYVTFEGHISDMPAFREGMNIELMCAVCEPFGRVTVEGMRSGLVVIGANTGGTVDIIEDGVNGLLYQQGNPADLAEKLRRVIDDEALAARLASDARAFSRTHFTAEANTRAINEILENAVKEAKNA